jgi:hypothetical protein
VLVWGGEARRGYHAVGPPEADLLDGGGTVTPVRINLTFRKAG